MSSGEGPRQLLTIQRMKSASGLWFLHLDFKVLFLFKIKFGKRYMLIYDDVLIFKLGFEHFQLRFYGERMKLKENYDSFCVYVKLPVLQHWCLCR